MRPAAASSLVAPVVARVLGRTPRHQWSSFAVLVDEEACDAKILTRGELVSFLRSADLPDLADEATARRVPPAGLLALFLGSKGPRFRVVGGEERAPGVPRGRTRP